MPRRVCRGHAITPSALAPAPTVLQSFFLEWGQLRWGGTKLKLRTIPKYKKQDTNKLQIPSTKFQTIDDRPQSWQSNRAASELTRQQYEAKFRGATGQQHNLPNP